jgi:hypothetical protein
MSFLTFTSARRVLFAGLYSGLTAGCFYGFGIYSPALKQQLGLTQRELMNINTIPYAFGIFSSAWGLITKRFGPGVSMAWGGLMMAVSQCAMFGMASQFFVLPDFLPPLPLMLVAFACVTFWGLQLISSAAFTAPIQHYPRSRGDVAAIVKSFVGAGGSITTMIFVVVWGTPTPDATALNALLLWAALSFGLNAVAATVVPRAPETDHDGSAEPRTMLSHLFKVIVLLGITAPLSSMVPNESPLHSTIVGVLIIGSLLPGVVIFGRWKGDADAISKAPDAVTTQPAKAATSSAFESQISFTCLEMARTPDAWLFAFSGAIILGSGNVLATNFVSTERAATT